MTKSIDPRERAKSHAEVQHVDFYAEALKASEQFREDYKGRLNVVKSSQMPLERSPDGLIKHIINERMAHQGMLPGHVPAVHSAR